MLRLYYLHFDIQKKENYIYIPQPSNLIYHSTKKKNITTFTYNLTVVERMLQTMLVLALFDYQKYMHVTIPIIGREKTYGYDQ